MKLLELQAASAGYNGSRFLTNINLEIHQGERIAVLGKSGAGKSTLLNLVYQQSRDFASLLPQELGLVKSLSVFHNVYMARLNHFPTWYNVLNLLAPRQKELMHIREVLASLQLDEKLRVPVAELSGGQQQRTAVARSLYQQNKLLIADEPVSAVDEQQSHTVLQRLCDVYDTVVFALHDTDLALQYAERIIGLNNGNLIFDKSTKTVSAAELASLYNN